MFYDFGFFDPCSAFSRFTTKTVSLGAHLNSLLLYYIEVECLTGLNIYPDDRKVLLEKFLDLYKNKFINPNHEIFREKEQDSFLAVVKYVLSKLYNEVVLSHDTFPTIVQNHKQPLENIRVGKLGIGKPFTWHGYCCNVLLLYCMLCCKYSVVVSRPCTHARQLFVSR